MFRNMPLNQFLSTAFDNVGRGIGMLPGALASLGGGGICLLSEGLTHLVTQNNQRNLREMI
jgi:hypothetical protein